MIEGLRAYLDMKATGLAWLGAIPAHWDVRRAKRMLKPTELPVRPIDEIVTCFRDGQVTLRKNRRSSGFMIALLEQGYQGVRAGQLVVHSMDAFAGAIGISDSEGKCTPEYIVCDPRESETLLAYYAWLLRYVAQTKYILAAYPAVRERAPRLRYPDLGELKLPAPPLDEQRLIVRFLDWHGAQAVKLIRAKKKIIALLNEQKQVIILRAVTRGLNPNVKLRPSDIPLLGDVPDGWAVKPLKHWAGINRRTLSQNTDPEYAFDYIDISAVGTGYLTSTPERMRFETSPSRARRIVRQGDTLISTVRTYLKAIYHVDRPWPDLIASTGFAVLTPEPSIDARFFGFVLQSKTFVDQVVANSIGVAYPAISETRLGSLNLCLPPSRLEQEAIIRHLQTATIDFDRSIEATQREITLIQEFRTRLIADVVTGKLDIRAVAACLPEITELEAIDNLVEGDDLGEAIDDTENEEVAA
jgi:type I restriction enzyme S subunit